MRQCYLKCIINSHAPIKLPHKVEVIIGRSKLTKIHDQSCSRQQISLISDCDNCIIELKQLGINPSGIDGFALSRNSIYKVKHGTRVEVLLNQYVHVIEFEPPPNNEGNFLNISKKVNDCNEMNTKKRLDNDNDETEDKIVKFRKIEGSAPIQGSSRNIWEVIDQGELYIFTSVNVKSSTKIAAFDMDGTLIKTKSGKVHPLDINDWQIAFPQISQKLKEQLAKQFKIVILSNQAPIGKGRVKIEDFKIKIENIVQTLQVPIQVFIATGRSHYRKPTTGMWKVLVEQKNDNVPVDMSESFYVGDAAGRKANWTQGKKKDHSLADILMAENLGLKFYTPEEFFVGHKISKDHLSKPEFNPKEITSEEFNDKLISNEKEILVLVGFPGSGKSFLAKQIEEKSKQQYVAVCRDSLGSWQKCAAEAEKLLQQGKSVIVDSTNPDVESRARWTTLAKNCKVACRCAKLTTTFAHARHNNKFRELMKIKHLPVNDIVFHTYKNKYKEPSTNEGFKEIVDINFSPCFDDEEAEKLYKMHLLEK